MQTVFFLVLLLVRSSSAHVFPLEVGSLVAGKAAEMSNVVADKETAIRIAKAALTEKFGKEKVGSQEPYAADLNGDVWTVVGNPHLPLHSTGGGLRVDISRSTGKIITIGIEA